MNALCIHTSRDGKRKGDQYFSPVSSGDASQLASSREISDKKKSIKIDIFWKVGRETNQIFEKIFKFSSC